MRSILERAEADAPQREAEWIVEAATGWDRGELARHDRAADPRQVQLALRLARRRAAGEPLQYVTGVAGFRHIEVEVGPGAFIPRPETEMVTGRAIDHLPPRGTLVEIGTGSGAAALAVAHERPDARVLASDIAPAALEWAQRNRDRLGLEVELLSADVFDGYPVDLKGRVDVILSNPPYIPEGFVLPAVVQDHEPAEALFAQDAGLAVIRRLASEGKEWLRPGGWLVMEMDQSQRTAVAELLRNAGFEDVDIIEDMAERPRIAEARKP